MFFRYACPTCGAEAVLRVRPGYEIPERVPYRCSQPVEVPGEGGNHSLFLCPGEVLVRVLTRGPLVDLGEYPGADVVAAAEKEA
jgi:hypothetical protein